MTDKKLDLIDNFPGIALRVDINTDKVLQIEGLYKSNMLDELAETKHLTLSKLRKLIFSADQKRITGKINQHIKNKENWNIEYRVNQKDKQIWLREQGQCSTQNGIPIVDLFIHDITWFKEKNAKLQKKMSLASKTADIKNEFFASMSHEIRTPMNAVMGMAQILAKTKVDFEQKQYLDTIISASDALVQIINDILDVSKLEAGKFDLLCEEQDLEVICLEVCNLLSIRAEEKQINLFLDFTLKEKKRVVVDGGRLRQILINLIGNAIKFTDQGDVTLVVELTSDKNEDLYSFSIKDTGIGISEKAQKSLFSAYSQADNTISKDFGGTGLGLQICQKLVEAMSGKIGIDSQLNKGSTFWFSIPLESVKEEQGTILNFNEKECLLIDSHPKSLAITKEVLDDSNLVVTSMSDPEEVLAYMTTTEKHFNLIVIQKKLLGLDGLRLVELIKKDKRYSYIPIVLLAPVGLEINRKELKKIGVNVYLTNPFSPTSLKKALHSLDSIQRKKEAIYISNKNIHSLEQENARYYANVSVLIADDVEVNRFILNSMLSKIGIVADFAENGLEALEKVKTNHYDLIFMDCRMPVMDGFEATKKIKSLESNKSKIPVIALTANAGQSDQQACHKAGMDDFMAKPYSETQLGDVIDTWIDSGKLQEKPANTAPVETDEKEEINLTQFNTLKSTMADEFFDFINSMPTKFSHYKSEIAGHLKDADYDSVHEKAHALKGLSALVGGVHISELAQSLEDAGKNKDIELATITLSKLTSANTRFESLIAHNLNLEYDKPVLIF